MTPEVIRELDKAQAAAKRRAEAYDDMLKALQTGAIWAQQVADRSDVPTRIRQAAQEVASGHRAAIARAEGRTP